MGPCLMYNIKLCMAYQLCMTHLVTVGQVHSFLLQHVQSMHTTVYTTVVAKCTLKSFAAGFDIFRYQVPPIQARQEVPAAADGASGPAPSHDSRTGW